MDVLITGGAGFIGCNLAAYHLRRGDNVVILDNFSRHGTSVNIRWLQNVSNGKLEIIRADIRNFDGLVSLVRGADVLYHLAAQVAVTTSLINPEEDFEINARGTLNVLEEVRRSGANPIIFYTSTNKVYGGLDDVKFIERGLRYEYEDAPFGISEQRPLDFHSPYGCSKGAADQYVRDYARIYGLNTVVFRLSCIYGPRQFGIEDQGWIAWFIIASILRRPIVIYGDGKQMRDALYIDDLIEAFQQAAKCIKVTRGNIYNIGGGPQNTISLLELVHLLEEALERKINLSMSAWRTGDQRVYVSDIRKAYNDFSWAPKTGIREGIAKLITWVTENKDIFNL